MNISNKRNPHLFQLNFGNTVRQDSASHKYLGIILQSNCNCEQIQMPITSFMYLRSYKYRLSRTSLETMNKSCILPQFDYADIVWDNCSTKLAGELESLRLDAVCTITGAVRGTSHETVYAEALKKDVIAIRF